MTINKGSEGPEILALSHIALLQGGGKGSENVDSSPTPPLSPTRAPRPASRESCGEGGGEHDSAMSGAEQCTHQMHQHQHHAPNAPAALSEKVWPKALCRL